MDSVQTIINNIILNFSALSEALKEQEEINKTKFEYVERELSTHRTVLKNIAAMINEELQ
jgi:hypothetical protein